MQNAPRGAELEHSAILLTFIKLQFVIKIFILSFYEWPFNTGFTVIDWKNYVLSAGCIGNT